MKKQGQFPTKAAPAPGWWARNRRRGAVLAGAGLLIGTFGVLIAPAWSNGSEPETTANHAKFDTASAKPAAVAGGVTLGMSTAVTATKADTADSLYEAASLAALCQDPETPPEEKTACVGVAGRSDRDLDGMLHEASKGGNVAAKTYLLNRKADEASARLDTTEPLDDNQRAEALTELKTSVTELRSLALASGDRRKLTQLASLYLRNADVLEGANQEAAVLTIAAGLSKGRSPADFNDIYATYSPEESAWIKQKAEQLAYRFKGAPATASDIQQAAQFAADCHIDKNGMNPCAASPY
jgi:hypothetical protein